jgi:hypothetical protein
MEGSSWKTIMSYAERDGHIAVRLGKSTREGGYGIFSKRSLVPEGWCYQMEDGTYDVCTECGSAANAHYYVWSYKQERWNAVCRQCFK